MKFRSWEWSFARVFCENQTAKVKFCQFNLWMFYCTSVVLSGKLFRIKPCLWLKPISVNLLCKFKSSQLVYSLQPLKVLPSSTYHLGMPYKGEQCSFYAAMAKPYLGENQLHLLNTRVHLGVHPFLLGMSIASLCNPLGSNPA